MLCVAVSSSAHGLSAWLPLRWPTGDPHSTFRRHNGRSSRRLMPLSGKAAIPIWIGACLAGVWIMACMAFDGETQPWQPTWKSSWFWSAVGSVIAVLGVFATFLSSWLPSVLGNDGDPLAANSPSQIASASPATSPTRAPATSPRRPTATRSGEPAGKILKSGRVTFTPDNRFNFDQGAYVEPADSSADAAQNGEGGLGALRGAWFARWDGKQPPTRSQCLAVEPGEHTLVIPEDEIRSSAYFCLRTDSYRYGYLQAEGITPNGGGVFHYHFAFVVWPNP
jgi:hypothetical protein